MEQQIAVSPLLFSPSLKINFKKLKNNPTKRNQNFLLAPLHCIAKELFVLQHTLQHTGGKGCRAGLGEAPHHKDYVLDISFYLYSLPELS